jgi:hypothetical protein
VSQEQVGYEQAVGDGERIYNAGRAGKIPRIKTQLKISGAT